jgi:hypothetical protein
MALTEIPEAVARGYKQWHEEQQRTGQMYARAECGQTESGNALWCTLTEATPEILREVVRYQTKAFIAGLKDYRADPRPELAEEIIRHMVLVDIAQHFLQEVAGLPG